MTAKELKTKFLNFFKEKKHVIIPSSSLIPEYDPTVLFTTAGMHPLIPYLLGEPHPEGHRLANVQPCVRTDDIDEVGDAWHLTFFEMLGNWSLGDSKAANGIGEGYFKREAIKMSFEFLTSNKWLSIPKERLAVSIFEGDKDAPRDDEAREIWLDVGVLANKIFFYGKKENWWGPPGEIGPCGPDTEIFYDTKKPHDPKFGDVCHPNCRCGRFVEIWNNVFMQYQKKLKIQKPKFKEYEFVSLKQKNVDTGMGLERTLAVLQGKSNVFETDLFWPIIKIIENLSQNALKGKAYNLDPKPYRIIADHMRAATFILAEGIQPSNIEQGYILRRLIRRVIRYARLLDIAKKENLTKKLVEKIIEIYGSDYPRLIQNKSFIIQELQKEEERFEKTLERGLKELKKIILKIKSKVERQIPGIEAFHLYDTYGFPLELTQELAREHGVEVDVKGFKDSFRKHQELSRRGAEKKFKGGLVEFTKETTRLHTATHLLHQALRDVLGKHVRQAGSNITAERLRFDFTHPSKLSKDQIKRIEEIVNSKIRQALPVTFTEMKFEEARKRGALAFFRERYPEKVKVYSIGDYSKEICGGPHVKNTRELGKFKIIKEEASSAGVRRIKAILV